MKTQRISELALSPAAACPRSAPRWSFPDPRINLLRRLLGGLRTGRLTVRLPSGASLEGVGAAPGPQAFLQIHHLRALRRLLLQGDVGFAESYVDGDWSSPDLVQLLRLAAANMSDLSDGWAGSLVFRLFNRVNHWRNANSRKGSQRNIISHYDLGNAFFERWLDPSMLYSSALWMQDDASLAQAQQSKLDRIVALLDVAGGEDVLEIGCGWGAMAQKLVEAGARSVVGLTLSPSQLEFARERLAAAGLAGTDLRLQDYRDVSGQFDCVVSVEMIEAVGEAYWPSYFAKIAQCLKPGGRALIQAILIDDRHFDAYRARPDFIQRHIFPGGFLPCDSAMRAQIAAAGLKLVAVEPFGLSYARTLAEWRRRFEAAWRDIAALGFDERFRRLWTYYLCYCEAGFLEQATDVRFYLIGKEAAQ